MDFKIANRLVGWFAFAIAAIVYILTAEPTASLWDCGEFITTSVGLQVGHPPGAPLFMIISRLFAIFAPSPDKQALMINYMSGICSAATVLFLCWTITFFAKRLLVKRGAEPSNVQKLLILLSGFIGSLSYAFTDTFWFSAVEGEVYAMSSLFTAVVFWAILKWDDCADEPHSGRWLVLIMYLMGLSVGVHLLNLLVIPAIVFVYYFRKYKVSKAGVVKAAAVAVVLLGLINFILIPYFIKVACWFELFFVNGLGMPLNSGVIVYVVLIAGGLFYGIRYSIRNYKPLMNFILTCLTLFIVGYSSYSMTVIRSLSNPPIDENSPDNVFDLLSYIQREQYGDSPLVYGQYYNAPVLEQKAGEPIYFQDKKIGRYRKVGEKPEYVYDKRFCTFFPRMHNGSRPYYPQFYSFWGGRPSGPVYNVDGRRVQAPGFGNNMAYFFKYQLGYMYWRYFMWNFSGRQNDEQGTGDIMNGNWITGIPFLDEIRLGNQKNLPGSIAGSKANNKYYMLPFLLGILGLVFQFRRGRQGKQDFSVLMILFFMTGVAIILYLNQAPMEPRERDYAYAGSFYAFSIWIGLGVVAVYKWLEKYMKKMDSRVSAVVVGTVCFVAVPLNLVAENWDDHDRSGRYATKAYAHAYLESCAPNAILFTFGDNDTFPLWYAQEVEGIRRDVRVVNLSLLSGDWYIDQMKREAYETPAVPISFGYDQYHGGKRDISLVNPRKTSNPERISLDVALRQVKNDKNKLGGYNYVSSNRMSLSVNKENAVANGTIRPSMKDSVVESVDFELPGSYLTKSQLMVLDILNTNDWKRPIYFGAGMGTDNYMGLQDFLQLEGAAYRLVPIRTVNSGREYGRIDVDILYENLMHKFIWGNIKDPKVNIDNFHRNTIAVIGYRETFQRLAMELQKQGDFKRSVEVLDKSLEELPLYQIPSDPYSPVTNYVPLYYGAKEVEKADALAEKLLDSRFKELRYIETQKGRFAKDAGIAREGRMVQESIKFLTSIMEQYGRKDKLNEIISKYLK